MKRSNIFITFISFLFLCFFASCLKDKDVDEGKLGVKPDKDLKLVEISGPVTGFYNIDLIASNTDTIITNFVTVRLLSEEPADKDIQVTLALNPTLVSDYNAAHGTNFVVPASSLYSLPSLTVTIPAGQRVGYLRLTTKPVDLQGPEYALGVQLVSVSDASIKLSGNYSKQIVSFAIRNKYDGNYRLRIKTVGWAAYGISDNLPATWPSNPDGTSIGLVTGGANSVRFFDYFAFGTFIQVAFTAGNAGATGFGATAPRFIFNTGTDQLTSVINDIPDDGRNRAFRINPAVTNSRFDPATKTIYAAYIMSQNGRPDQFIYDTLTYTGPR